MRTKEISKYQFVVTVTPSEHLIMEGYSKLFHVNLQDAALIMCVHGWNSYAQKMIQYNKNARIQPIDSASEQLLENEKVLNRGSDEGKAFEKFMASIEKDLHDVAG